MPFHQKNRPISKVMQKIPSANNIAPPPCISLLFPNIIQSELEEFGAI